MKPKRIPQQEHDTIELIKLGREVLRMINDVSKVTPRNETGYTRRTFTFRQVSVEIFIALGPVADVMDRAAAAAYTIKEATPPSTIV